MNWVRVKRNKPCPICGRPDWCSVSEDGTVVVCMRTESPKPCKSGGWSKSGPWTVTGSGTHTLKWRYAKDESGSAGSDCGWVDYLQ